MTCDDMHERIEFEGESCPLCEAMATISRLGVTCDIYREHVAMILDRYEAFLKESINAHHTETA